jgi:signal peptidase
MTHPRTVRIACGILALAAFAAAWAFLAPPSLGGSTSYAVVHGVSMEPRLHEGDLVLVRAASDYRVGDVVAYRVPMGQVGAGHVVIHRIIGGNGRTGWRMKGDNRTAPDLWYPTNHDVIGAKELRIPNAWFVLRIFHMPVLLAIFAGFAVFFWIAFLGDGEPDTPDEVER